VTFAAATPGLALAPCPGQPYPPRC